MKVFLNKFLTLIITGLIFMSFYLTPKSTVAYNTTNLSVSNKMVRTDTVKTLTQK